LAGLVVAASGSPTSPAHSCSTGSTKAAFPRNTRQRVYIHGGIETALGLGQSSTKTRPLAVVGTIGYVAYLAGNAARNR
jgi:hypothetical protein